MQGFSTLCKSAQHGIFKKIELRGKFSEFHVVDGRVPLSRSSSNTITFTIPTVKKNLRRLPTCVCVLLRALKSANCSSNEQTALKRSHWLCCMSPLELFSSWGNTHAHAHAHLYTHTPKTQTIRHPCSSKAASSPGVFSHSFQEQKQPTCKQDAEASE